MNNILVISNFIPPEHSATGRIAYSIAKELSKTNRVRLICLSSNEDSPKSGDLTVCKFLTRYGRYKKMVADTAKARGLAKIFLKIKYKLYYKHAQKVGLESVGSHLSEFKAFAKEYALNNGIDCVITVSNPFELQEVGQNLKQEIPSLKWFPYLMDSNRHNISYKAAITQEQETLRLADKILIVPALTFDKDFCSDFEGRTEVVDLPIIPTDTEVKANENTESIKLIFAGMFYKDVRDPKFLLELMSRLPSNYQLELYYGGCADTVKKYKEILGDRLNISGFISPEELEGKMSNANLVVNIGNTVLNQVSSKAYDLIATGKPILNFYQNEKDISLEHLRRYPLCYHIDYQNITDTDIDGLIKWATEVAGKKLDYLQATKNLEEKRLSSVARRIAEIIELRDL